VEIRADDKGLGLNLGIMGALTVSQLCANWILYGGNGRPPTTPAPILPTSTPRPRGIASTKRMPTRWPSTTRTPPRDNDYDPHLDPTNDQISWDGEEDVGHEVFEEEDKCRLFPVVVNNTSPQPTIVNYGPQPGPSNLGVGDTAGERRGIKRPSVGEVQDGEPEPKHRPTNPPPVTTQRPQPERPSPVAGINFPFDPYLRHIAQRDITYPVLLQLEGAMQEIERRRQVTQIQLDRTLDDRSREISFLFRRTAIFVAGRRPWDDPERVAARERCNSRIAYRSELEITLRHELTILTVHRENLFNQQNAIRLGLRHLTANYPAVLPFTVVIRWNDVVAIVNDRVPSPTALPSIMHGNRPKRNNHAGENDLGVQLSIDKALANLVHEEARVRTASEYNRELANMLPNSFKIISFIEDPYANRSNCSPPWYPNAAGKLESNIWSMEMFYFAVYSTIFGWHEKSEWYMQRTNKMGDVFFPLVKMFKLNINPANVVQRDAWITEITEFMAKKISITLLWYYEPEKTLDEMEAKFKEYSQKIVREPPAPTTARPSHRHHHDELKKRISEH